MSIRYPGGLITKTPVTPTTSAAPGVWTIEQALQYIKAGTWPIPGGPSDPDFEYVTMLLPGNGTNGAQNNTFLDSSTNNFTITRNGNTTQGTFSPYGSLWSIYSPFSANRIAFNSNAAFGYGTGDWSIEFWVFIPSNFTTSGSGSGGVGGLVSNRVYAGGQTTPVFYTYSPTNQLVFEPNGSSGLFANGLSSYYNTWIHVVGTRQSGVSRLFVNGILQDSIANTADAGSANKLDLFCVADGYQYNQGSSLSNIRVCKGSVPTLYQTSSTTVGASIFTPPTTPLTTSSQGAANVSFLFAGANRFVDQSASPVAVSQIDGSPSVQRFSPFSPTASYDPATIGGSGYFDGTGDYLRYATNTSSQFSLGTDNFTDEAWVFPTAFSGGSTIISVQTQTSGSAANGYALYLNGSGQPGVLAAASSGGYLVNFLGTAIPLNAWTHLAVTRSGNTFTLWRNGVSDGTATSSVSITQDTTAGYGGWNVAGSPQTGQNHNGYISNSRLVKGTAVYTANFTPPTSPVTAITNTSLLLNFTNGGIIDNAMMNDLETVGNAQISTTQSKFGGGSLAFDGTGDYLTAPSSSLYTLGPSGANFTIEMWVYPVAFGLLATTWENNTSLYTNRWLLYINGSGNLLWHDDAGNTIINAGSVSANVWTHIAVVRNGSTITVYKNGTSAGTQTTAQAYTTQGPLFVGAYPGAGVAALNGYIDDLRITKGVARYTANFTPPTAALPTR